MSAWSKNECGPLCHGAEERGVASNPLQGSAGVVVIGPNSERSSVGPDREIGLAGFRINLAHHLKSIE